MFRAHIFSVKLPLPEVALFEFTWSSRVSERAMFIFASRLSMCETRMASGVAGIFRAPNSGSPWCEKMM